MILKPFPAAERPALRLKVYAAGALIGRRAEWGYRRKWEANYLFIVRSARCCSRVTHTHTHTHTRPFVRDYPGEPVPER